MFSIADIQDAEEEHDDYDEGEEGEAESTEDEPVHTYPIRVSFSITKVLRSGILSSPTLTVCLFSLRAPDQSMSTQCVRKVDSSWITSRFIPTPSLGLT
jgi:hypothetical protein